MMNSKLKEFAEYLEGNNRYYICKFDMHKIEETAMNI